MNSAVMTTSWDDGHPLDQRIADLLLKYHLTGTFYIPRQTSREVMPDSQIRDLSNQFEIGAHTLSHERLTEISTDSSAHEISASKDWIQQVTGKPCNIFCPPGGQFRQTHLDQIASAGFSAVRTTELMSLDSPRRNGTLLIMPTTLQARPQPFADYMKNFIKRRALRNAFLYLRHGRARQWTTAAGRLLKHTLAHGGVFHLWGHSWEIDRYGQWTQLEDIFRLMSQAMPALPCLTNGQIFQRP